MNRHPFIEQLFAEGYKVGSIVALRAIAPKSDTNPEIPKTHNFIGILTQDDIELRECLKKDGYKPLGRRHPRGLDWLTTLNRTHGIYYNINGGRNNKEVTRFYAIAWEDDKSTLDQQQQKIEALGLAPTTVVRTRRSNHVKYRVVDHECRIEDWGALQEQMAWTVGGDPAIKDRPRLMRAAGFNHLKWINGKLDTVPCQLTICDSNQIYTIAEIKAAMEKYAPVPYSSRRYHAYQFALGKLNQRKRGIKYPSLDPDLFRHCPESELEEVLTRAKLYARLCELQHQGKGDGTDPETAWSSPLDQVKRRKKIELDIDTVNPPVSSSDHPDEEKENIVLRWARLYGLGWSRAGTPGARANWDTCRCPAHGSSSDNYDNCHVNRYDSNYDIGAVSCKSGCETSEIIKAFRKLAEDAGDETWNWSLDTKDKQITEGQWISKFRLPDLLKKLTQQAISNFPGFDQQKSETQQAAANPNQWRNAKLITRADIQEPEVYQNEGAPLLTYRPGDMKYIWQKAKRKGYKAVLDTSLMGVGKSEEVGKQKLEFWFDNSDETNDTNTKQKLFYASESGQNTTAPSLEGWQPLARRHNGAVYRYDKLTGGGNPFIERAKPGELPDIPSNCWAASLHHIFGEKNVGNAINPICEKCSELKKCKKGEGDVGTGFRNEMKESLAELRLKGTLEGLPLNLDFKIVGFIDEVTNTFKPTKELTVDLNDVSQAFIKLHHSDSELFQKLEFIRGILELHITEANPPKFGYDLATIKSWFNQRFDSEDFLEVVEKLRERTVQQSIEEINKLNKEITESEIKEKISLNWLLPFCEILGKISSGSVRIHNKKIVITIPNEPIINQIRSWDFRVFLDATANRDELARSLGYEPWEILWVMQMPERKTYENLRVIQITGIGKCGKDRKQLAQTRIAAVEQGLIDWASGTKENSILNGLIGKPKEIFSNGFDPNLVSHIRHLKFKKEKDLYYFGGTAGQRGSNAAQNCQLLIMEGLASENMGAALAKYHTIYGNNCTLQNEQFLSWYTHRVIGETFQGIGRTRFSRRTDQVLPVFIVSDMDLSGLINHFGLKIEQIDAFDVTPDAGTRSQKSFAMILEAAKLLQDQGAKLTQKAIATTAHLSQGLVSKLLSKLGGWKAVKKIFQVLYKTSPSTGNNFCGFKADKQNYLDEYLAPVVATCLDGLEECEKSPTVEEGEVLVNDVAIAIDSAVAHVGTKGLEAGLDKLTLKGQARLLSLFLLAIPEEARSQIQEQIKKHQSIPAIAQTKKNVEVDCFLNYENELSDCVDLSEAIAPLEEYSEDEISSRVEFLAQCDAEHERMMAQMNRESKTGYKLQPVEVLQAGLLDGWIKGYWLSAKYVLKNLAGQIRHWALFDEEGERWDFLGEVRPVTN